MIHIDTTSPFCSNGTLWKFIECKCPNGICSLWDGKGTRKLHKVPSKKKKKEDSSGVSSSTGKTEPVTISRQ